MDEREIYPPRFLKIQMKIKQTSKHSSYHIVFPNMCAWIAEIFHKIHQTLAEFGSETVLVWEKERRKNKSSVTRMPEKRALLDLCSYSLSVIIFLLKKSEQMMWMWCFRPKKHVRSLQPGCQGRRKVGVPCCEINPSPPCPPPPHSPFTYLGRRSYEAPQPKWQQVLPKPSRWGRPGRYDGCWRVSCSSSLQHPSSHLHFQDKNWFQQGKSELWQKYWLL